MTLPVIAFPDVQEVVCGWLRSNAPTGVKAYIDLPGNLTDLITKKNCTLVQVQRVSGFLVSPFVDEASLDIDYMAKDFESVRALAKTIRPLIIALPGTTTGGAVITQVVEEVAPCWRPDTNPNVRRYGSSVRVSLRPA